MYTDEQRSLNELDRAWGPAPLDATPLMQKVYDLRDRPLTTLTIEDLRLLVSQRISLDITLPLAEKILAEHPETRNNPYPANLQEAVTKIREDSSAAPSQ